MGRTRESDAPGCYAAGGFFLASRRTLLLYSGRLCLHLQGCVGIQSARRIKLVRGRSVHNTPILPHRVQRTPCGGRYKPSAWTLTYQDIALNTHYLFKSVIAKHFLLFRIESYVQRQKAFRDVEVTTQTQLDGSTTARWRTSATSFGNGQRITNRL